MTEQTFLGLLVIAAAFWVVNGLLAALINRPMIVSWQSATCGMPVSGQIDLGVLRTE